MIYLDNAATTLQKPPQVLMAMQEAMRRGGNAGRGDYAAAKTAGEWIYRTRESAAALFHVPKPEQVAFTCNATMGLNMAIKGLLAEGGHAVISGYEHNAVVRPLTAMRGVTWEAAAAPLFEPEAQLEAFRRALTPDTRLIVCTHVSNVFGYVLPIEEIAALCREKGIPLVVDASQSAGTVPLDVQKLPATMYVCMPGHKGLYGPQGTGLLLALRQQGTTLIEGGTGSDSGNFHQPTFLPDRLESGTLNAPGIAGLGEGIRFVQAKGVEQIGRQERELAHLAAEQLRRIPGVEVFTGAEHCASGVLSFRADWTDCETLAQRLASVGIALRAGLHCAALAHRTAGTEATGTLRASFGVFNTPGDAMRLAQAVRAAR